MNDNHLESLLAYIKKTKETLGTYLNAEKIREFWYPRKISKGLE